MNHKLSRARNLALTLTVLTAGLTGVAGPATGAEPSAAATAGGTSAGTIVYIHDHNVWISRGDGTGAKPETSDGSEAAPYGSPTQSDAGVVVATHVNRLVRMTQAGQVLNTIDPPALPTSVGTAIDGTPIDAAISPDGTRIVYTFAKYFTEFSGYRFATGYTAADHLTDPAQLGTSFHWAPSWVGNHRTLQTGGWDSQVNLHDVGGAFHYWFDDWHIYEIGTDLGNTQLSRDGKYLTAVRGTGDFAAVYWYRVNGNAQSGGAPANPTPMCKIMAAGIDHPTWGPDNLSLAWQEPDGVYTRSMANEVQCEAESKLILPGASEPHWSPAALAAPAPGPGPGPGPGPRPGTGPGTGPVSPAPFTNTILPALKGTAKVGKKLKATTGTWSVSDVSFTFQWFRNGKKVAGKSGRAQTYRVTRVDRGKTIYVRVTATKGGVVTSARSKSVRVKK